MKEVVPIKKNKGKTRKQQRKKKAITLVLTAGPEWRRQADNQKGVNPFVDTVGERSNLTEHGLTTIFLGTWYLWNKDAAP